MMLSNRGTVTRLLLLTCVAEDIRADPKSYFLVASFGNRTIPGPDDAKGSR
jgi:hypothetical protein